MSGETATRKAQTRAIFDRIATDYDGAGMRRWLDSLDAEQSERFQPRSEPDGIHVEASAVVAVASR